MIATLEATIERELSSVVGRLDGVYGLLLASTDGRLIGRHLTDDVEAVDAISALVASAQQIARRLSELMWDGPFEEITVRSTSGYVMLYSVGSNAVLAVLTHPSVSVARVHLDARDICPTLQRILYSHEPVDLTN